MTRWKVTGRRRRIARLALPLALLGSASGLVACTGSTSGGAGTGINYVAGDNGTFVLLAPDQRREAVSLAGNTVEGAKLDLASLRGQVVVLNVWGSWCPPCRKEAPDLEAAAQALKPKGVAFLGIATREDDAANAVAFQTTFGITYQSLLDDGGKLLLSLRGAVPPNAIPSTLVLDQQGRIAARISGATTKATVVGLVEDVLAGHTTATVKG